MLVYVSVHINFSDDDASQLHQVSPLEVPTATTERSSRPKPKAFLQVVLVTASENGPPTGPQKPSEPEIFDSI